MALMVMTGDDFAKHLLAGERDFSRIQLDRFDLKHHDSYPDIQQYLKTTSDLDFYPIMTDDSSFRYLHADRLYLPFLRGRRLDLRGAVLRGAYLYRADLQRADLRWARFDSAYLGHASLEGANLRCATLVRADLDGADLENVDLAQANLEGASLRETHLTGANLEGASLLGVRELDYAIGVRAVTYHQTKVDISTKRTIVDLWQSEMDQWFLMGR